MKILHVFYDIGRLSGYQIRSKCIVANQQKLGLDVNVAYLPRRPGNRVETVFGGAPAFAPDIPRNLRRLFDSETPVHMPEALQRFLTRRLLRLRIGEIADTTRPDIIHAHSSWMSAAQGFAVARKLEIPFLYEMRGLWEEDTALEQKGSKLGFSYQYFRARENHLIRNSDAVVVLSEGLKKEVVLRGANPEWVGVVPNGVDTDEFVPRPRDSQLAESLGCGARTIVGYVSSLRLLEGIRYFIEALPKVDKQAFALIVGDGPERDALEKLVSDLGINDRIKFTGAVPHAEIKRYYSIIDIFVVPRINVKSCHIVTPLKPLEAMAMGKCVVMSDVGGLRELANGDETAVFFKPEDSSDLAEKLNMLIADRGYRQKLGENARLHVVERKDWRKVVKAYLPLYEKLVR